MRLSSSPMYVNQFTGLIKSILYSPDSFLKFITMPNNNEPMKPGEVPSAAKLLEQRGMARRLQRPTFPAIFAQIIITASISFAIAFTSVLPFTSIHGNSPLKLVTIFSTVLPCFIHLYQSDHEIDPRPYRSNYGLNRVIYQSYSGKIVQSVFGSGLLIIGISIYQSIDVRHTLVCCGAALIIMMYLYLFDFTLRVFLVATPNIKKVIEDATGDGSVEVLIDVVLRSLCHSNNDLVKKMSDMSTNPGRFDLEKEELQRNETALKSMATTLVYKTNADEAGPHLEEDILRLAILTSILTWVRSSVPTRTSEWSALADNYTVPLCRGLCAYFGGLGEALLLVAAKKHIFSGDWLLPLGALFLAECAVEAASFCLSPASSNNVTWSNSHRATLVPAFINSAHRLETGLIKYAMGLANIKASSNDSVDKINLLTQICPEVVPLFNTINSCTKILLEKIPNESRRFDFLDSFDLQHWCKEKLPSVSGNKTGI